VHKKLIKNSQSFGKNVSVIVAELSNRQIDEEVRVASRVTVKQERQLSTTNQNSS